MATIAPIVTDTGATTPLTSKDENPISPVESGQKLEKLLQNRVDSKDLVDRNVLKNTGNLAPSLAAQKELLERSMLEDRLGDAIAKRPPPGELVREGILLADEAPPEVTTDGLQGDAPAVTPSA